MTRRSRPVLVALAAGALLAPLTLATSAGAAPARTSPYGLDAAGPAADDIYPEGIATSGSTYYVTSTTDGTVYRGDVKAPTATPFLTGGRDGRTSAIGLTITGDRLVVAGGGTGRAFVYGTADGALLASYGNGLTDTFVNDAAAAPDGAVYLTDSRSPYLYRIAPGATTDGQAPLERFLDFTGTAFAYGGGFNANGIVVTADGRYAIVVASNTGTLFRVDLRTKDVREVVVPGADLTNGDGLLLRGRSLYVLRNANATLVKVQLDGSLTSGRVVGDRTDPTFAFPTTLAEADGRFLFVNSQFDVRARGGIPAPFSVSSTKTF